MDLAQWPAIRMDSNIDTRSGWPTELRVLLEQHPRSVWRTRGSSLTEFWLHQHEHFRHQSAALQAGNDDFRAERIPPDEFCARIAPRLQAFLSHLHGHHQVEDFHYFPSFRAAEQRLARGFDVLASDHELIHTGLGEIVESINALIELVRGGGEPDAQLRAGERFATVSERLYGRLQRHLDDEEDLVIPVMLAHGD
jgi:Hemerythrin HHE cation binding domain